MLDSGNEIARFLVLVFDKHRRLEMTARNIWLEDNIAAQNVSVNGPDRSITLGLGLTHLGRSRLAALSPDCTTAIVAKGTWIKLFHLDLDKFRASRAALLSIDDIEDVALTNDALVVLTKTQLEIYQYEPGQTGISATLWQVYPHKIAIPACVAIHGSRWGDGVQIAVGGVGSASANVHLLQIRTDDTGNLSLVPRHTYGCSPIDSPKSVSFCAEGCTILTVSHHSSCSLVWHIRENTNRDILSSQAIRIAAPDDVGQNNWFLKEAQADLLQTSNGQGMTSASLFRSPASHRKYVFCTVDRAGASSQRSQVAPLAPNASDAEVDIARENQNEMTGGSWQDYAEAVVAGCTSSDGCYLGVVERSGEVRVFRVIAHPSGGLASSELISVNSIGA